MRNRAYARRGHHVVRVTFRSPPPARSLQQRQDACVVESSRRLHRRDPLGRNRQVGPCVEQDGQRFNGASLDGVISVSAVGSMKESIRPGDVVLPDQFIDLTKRRVSTFFDEGIVAHVGFGEPVCSSVADVLEQAGRAVGARLQRGGTYVCMEGPQFSTKAESRLYRQWGVDVIGMTNMPEAKLAREAELCYATVALATDYDCWHDTEEAVTVEAILATLHKNVALAKQLLKAALPKLAPDRTCVCHQALRTAIVTAPDCISATAKRRLNLLIAPSVRTRKGKR